MKCLAGPFPLTDSLYQKYSLLFYALQCDHGLWLTVANVLAGGTVRGACEKQGAAKIYQLALYHQVGSGIKCFRNQSCHFPTTLDS